MFVAVVSVSSHYIGKTVAFNMGWWVSSSRGVCPDEPKLTSIAQAFTFPLGSLTLLTFSLGNLFASMFFK